MKKHSVLFVCLGNICRSPLAEGIFRQFVTDSGMETEVIVDSAGTGGWHEGNPPDPRSVAVAGRHGIDLTSLRARQVRDRDFEDFDLIVGMDRSNVTNLKRVCPQEMRPKVHLFSALALGQDWDVPDPYYGGADGFEAVYQMLSEGCSVLADELKSSLLSRSGKTSSVR